MLKRYQTGICYLYRLTDVAVVVTAWFAAYWLRFYAPLRFPAVEIPAFSGYAALAPLVAVVWLSVLSWMHVYESRRLVGRVESAARLLRAHGMAVLTFVSLTYFVENSHYSRGVMMYFALLSAVALVSFRTFLITVLRHLRASGFNLRHVVAVGEGPVLERVIERLGCFPELGLRVKGVVISDDSSARAVQGLPVVGRFSHIAEIIREVEADEVLLALPPSQSQQLDQILSALKDETVDIRVVPNVDRYVALGCEIENFDGVPIVRINDSPLVGVGAWFKRATDVAVASVGLVLISPLLVAIAFLVKVTSPGPILYAQERMGLDGRTFRMFKFRSMKADCEAQSGPMWAKKVDDRRTPLGTFLRKTSLDELPQLWNVIRGDMSLVGPRPERPVFVDNFRTQIPHYMLRHKVRAGITGWAQVNGWRGDTSLERRVECDLFYIRNWSYLWDLKILVLTLFKGFVNKNAY